MKYQLKCAVCGHTFWIEGHEESDTNALVLNENDSNWSDSCAHVAAGGDYEVIDGELIDDSDDFPEPLP